MNFKKKKFKLFIISGKARSGKGEISTIIKDYYRNKKVITISFGHYIKDYVKRISTWDGNEDTKPRDLLQQVGIELIKNKIDNKLFIRRILEDILVFSYFYDIIVINDARLIDEMQILKESFPDSTSIRVIRNNYNNSMSDAQNNHKTEIDLDNFNEFDYVVYNDNFEKLKHDIEEILKEVK